MASTDAIPVPRKNAAFRFYFPIRKNDGTLITTWAGADSEVSKDGGAFADCTNEATEIGTSGCGYIDLTSTEMNADSVMYKLTVTNTGALPLVVSFFPEESGDYRVDASALATAAALAAVASYVDTEVAAIKAVTDALPNAGALTSLATAANLATVAGYIDTEVAAIKAVTDNLPNSGSLSSLATAAALATVAGYLDTEVAAILAAVDTEVAAIKAVTDLLPDAGALTSLATAAALATVDDFLDTEIAAIKAKTDNLPTDPADASDVAASFSTVNSTLSTIAGYIDTEVASILAAVDTEVAAIKAKTDNLPAAPAAVGDIPTAIQNADAVLSRNVSNVEGTAGEHTLCTIVLACLEYEIVGTDWIIKRTNGTTTHATKPLTTDAAAEPVTGVT